MKSAYEVLQVSENVTEMVLKVVYRKLAADLHPDRGGSTERLKEVNWAHDILKDPAKRAAHDRELAESRLKEKHQRLSNVFEERLGRTATVLVPVPVVVFVNPFTGATMGYGPPPPIANPQRRAPAPSIPEGTRLHVHQRDDQYERMVAGATRMKVHDRK